MGRERVGKWERRRVPSALEGLRSGFAVMGAISYPAASSSTPPRGPVVLGADGEMGTLPRTGLVPSRPWVKPPSPLLRNWETPWRYFILQALCQAGWAVRLVVTWAAHLVVLQTTWFFLWLPPLVSFCKQQYLPPPPPPEAEQTFVILYPNFVTGFSPGGGLLSSRPAQSSPEQGWAADLENRKQAHL